MHGLMSPVDVKGPPGSSRGAFDLCALGRIRTCNLLIRRIGQGALLDDDSL